MQLGFVSAILPDFTLEQILQTAADLNYDCVELMCWPRGSAERRYAGVTHLDVASFSEDDAARTRELAARRGVAISGLGYYPNPLSPDPEEARRAVEHIRALIVAAGRLGVKRANSFVGRDWTRGVDENWGRFLETWRPLVALAEEHDVRIGIENCPMLFGRDEWPGGKNLATTPAIWRRMFAEIPSRHFGLNYDPSHMVWQFMDYLSPLREFAGRLSHLHAKDARIDQEKLNSVGILGYPKEFHTPKLPGMGDVDWGRFFSVLTDVGYAGPVCVEVEDRAYEGSIEARIASLRQSATFLRNYIPKRAA